MVELVPNYTYQSENPMINAFMKYIKDITSINNGTILYAHETFVLNIDNKWWVQIC